MNKEEMNELYAGDAFVWGTEPSRFAKELLQWIPEGSRTILELGSGEGRDSVFFAEQGFSVISLDAASAGHHKAERLSKERKVQLPPVFITGDMNTYEVQRPVDVIYAMGSLQYVHPNQRAQRFEHWKQMTKQGGIHFMFARPDAPLSPDWGSGEYPYGREELLQAYLDWEILQSYEYRFPCDSSGVPHVHAARVLVARNSKRDGC